MDTGSYKGRTSHFSWHCLFSHLLQTGRLCFALMTLIATMEPALAVPCSNPPDPSDTAKCCKYYTNLDSGSVNVEPVTDMAQCLSIATPYADIIAVSPAIGCALPGQGVFNDPVPPRFASDPWEQHGVIWYFPTPSTPGHPMPPWCSGPQGGYARGLPVLLLWWGTPCTLSLTGPGGTDGALADAEPGRQADGLRAETLCNGVPTPKDITLTLTAVDNSGGHQHVPGRSTGNLSVIGGTTPLTFAYTAPAVSGDYTITARCTDGTCNEAMGFVWVGIHGLKSQASSTNHVLLPNRDANHLGNHYVTPNTEGKVADFAAAYHKKFLNDPVLHFNDASLIRGGLFDINSNWQLPHETHRLGRNVDVKANEFYHEPSQSIPSWNYIDFWNMGERYGCYVALHSGATPNEHFHLHCP